MKDPNTIFVMELQSSWIKECIESYRSWFPQKITPTSRVQVRGLVTSERINVTRQTGAWWQPSDPLKEMPQFPVQMPLTIALVHPDLPQLIQVRKLVRLLERMLSVMHATDGRSIDMMTSHSEKEPQPCHPPCSQKIVVYCWFFSH